MPQADLYHWASRRKYKLTYEDLGDKLKINWGSMPRPVFMDTLAEVKGMEGRKFDPDTKTWTVKHPKLSMRNAVMLGFLCNGTVPDCSPLLKRFALSSEPEQVDPPFNVNYYPYQLEDYRSILHYRRFELALDMGLGKTLISLSAMVKVKETLDNPQNHDDRDLFWVIGPRSACRAWARELNKWPTDLRPQVITNSHQSIERAMRNAKFPPLFVVLDESANMRNSTAKRTQATLELSRLMHQYWKGEEYFVNLSGTPAPKDPTNWWTQLEIIVPGLIRENHPAALRDRVAYVEKQEGPHGSYPVVKGWNTDEVANLYSRIKPAVSTRLKKNCLDLPDKVYIVDQLTPDPGTLSAARLAVESLPAIEALTVVRQLSDGFKYQHDYTEEGKRVRTGTDYIESPKDVALKEYLDELSENEENRIVIWAAYHAAIDKVCNLCAEKGWTVIRADGRGWTIFGEEHENREPLDLFQSPDEFTDPVAFVGNPESVGEGLTLTAASSAIYYSNSFKADKRIQSEDRIHRIGMDTNKGARIIDLVNLPTDQLILDNIKRKRDLQSLTQGEILSVVDKMALEKV